jgi:GNAT superfamily N-acetyltransferase
VVPGERGHGIGTALLKAAEEEVLGRGAELLEINVDGEDIAARRFYERHGARWRRIGLGSNRSFNQCNPTGRRIETA